MGTSRSHMVHLPACYRARRRHLGHSNLACCEAYEGAKTEGTVRCGSLRTARGVAWGEGVC